MLRVVLTEPGAAPLRSFRLGLKCARGVKDVVVVDVVDGGEIVDRGHPNARNHIAFPIASSAFQSGGGTGITERRLMRTNPKSLKRGSDLTCARVTGDASSWRGLISNATILGLPAAESGYADFVTS